MQHPYTLMGIVNVTPDSFSDGGAFLDADAAIAHALALVEQGASILDIGGESTRPGAEPVTEREELRRVLPVLEGLAAEGVRARISIDTSKSAVAAAAIERGASIVNDVSALRADPEMAPVIADAGVSCCLMHMLGEPRTMQKDPRYDDVVLDVRAFLRGRTEFALGAGIAHDAIMLDPGIGFGKTVAHNLALLDRLQEIVSLGSPVVIGTSRKSFIARVIGEATGGLSDAAHRLGGTIATNLIAMERGASIFRVHDVGPVRDALAVAAATFGAA